MQSLSALVSHSPYLTQLAHRQPELVRRVGAGECAEALEEALERIAAAPDEINALSRCLREGKAAVALLTALADLSGQWPLEKVTEALTRFADAALNRAVNALLAAAGKRGEIILSHPQDPSRDSGLVVLGMGKLGAFELNYSSDIDLIILYQRSRLPYRGRASEQHFYNRLAHDLVSIMQDRTAHGYVFRTDLRLRPDPSSTPPAVSTEAAAYYYESVGQNWERAAMIKARPVAGDIAAGEEFLKAISPFMWRRNLDYAALQDIHSIKRQMDARTGRRIELPGHNVKLGQGGIREIEFFTQIHQLIWGGKKPELRLRGTCETLSQLVLSGIVENETATALTESYRYLRTLEHRLQMVDDQQTHTLPASEDGIAAIAGFMGYEDTEPFEKELLSHLRSVNATFAGAFGASERLGDTGNLVFTGVSHDPDTLATLSGMGYRKPETISELIMGWHHGSRRCTRTKRARELLTELMPTLLKRFAETADPDAAFLHFDGFLTHIPSGVQIFSLFTAHPPLLSLIADIMGSAPVLAETLSRHPALLESVLYGDFYHLLPGHESLTAQLDATLEYARTFEERMETLRRFKNERQFQAGVQLLKGLIDAERCGAFLALLAEIILHAAWKTVCAEFEQSYGAIEGSRFAVLGFGRLGSEEMTFGSDLDLVFVYDVPDFEAYSSGERGFTASVYFNRLSQRLLSAFSAMGREGRLYEADIRLRPFGKQGLTAISFQALTHYFTGEAWTFEFMALTRARAVAGDASLKEELNTFIGQALRRPRDIPTLRKEVDAMRGRVAEQFPPTNPWDLKYARGGLIDLDFLAQYLLLAHAPAQPSLLLRRSTEIFAESAALTLISPETARVLTAVYRFLSTLQQLLRLCHGEAPKEAHITPGLARLLIRALDFPDFDTLKKALREVETTAFLHYMEMLGSS